MMSKMMNNCNKIIAILQVEYPKGTLFYASLSGVYKDEDFVVYLREKLIPTLSEFSVEDLTSALQKYMEEE